jgi:DNA-binding transcriptional ArsR family regulator
MDLHARSILNRQVRETRKAEALTSQRRLSILKPMIQYHEDAVFRALADPTRRAMLERLDNGPASITALAEPFDVSLTAITQHVRVLEHAALITSVKDGRQRICSLERTTLQRAEAWLAERRIRWDQRLDRLEQHLDRAAASSRSRSRKGPA